MTLEFTEKELQDLDRCVLDMIRRLGNLEDPRIEEFEALDEKLSKALGIEPTGFKVWTETVKSSIDQFICDDDEEPEEPEDNELAPCPKCGKETLKCVAFLDGAFTSGMLIRCDSCGHQFPHQTPREYIDYCLWDDDPSVEKYNNYMREHFPEMVMKVEKLSDHLEVIGKDDKAEKSS